jgi:hypothetical protein
MTVQRRIAVLAVCLAACAAGAGTAAAAPIPWGKLSGLHRSPVPWTNDSSSLYRRLRPLKLNALGQEGAAVHIHAHLDVYVAGQHVKVPALVGIDVVHQFITELHTHDTTGVLHVESPSMRTFTLGQFFGEWGVKLSPSWVGPYPGPVLWWVNGKLRKGDPAALVLRAHQEIVVAVGVPPLHVPKSYRFPLGE